MAVSKRPVTVLLSTTCGLLVVFFGLRFFWNYESRAIETEFAHIQTTGRVSDEWAAYDLICFNSNTGFERPDFARAAANAGYDLKESLSACGGEQSCCTLNSDGPGSLGFVRGKNIRCVAARFAYLLEGRPEACIKPSRLKVTQEKFTTTIHPPGRPWVGEIGTSYWKIEEK